jgi:Fe-S-cluster containining protein
MKEIKSIKLYNSLIEKLKHYETKLVRKYGESINCKKGCSDCCTLESIFSIEAYMIYSSQIDARVISESYISNKREEACVFLKDKSCAIYPVRPVICRTHGYPVLIDGKVDMCHKNFQNIKSIDSEYILDLENLNNAIASINIIFQKEQREIDEKFFLKERISLMELKNLMFDK